MADNSDKYPIKKMCKVLKVCESGYYRWFKNKNKLSKRQILSVEIKEIISEHPDNYNYGIERIITALSLKNISVSKGTVYRSMRESGFIHKRRIPHGITKADTETQDKENLLKRDFTSKEPFTKLLTDITEIQCLNGKLYVSPILDCFSGEIISLEMRDNMKKELCTDTVKNACGRYNFKGAVLHSDRGCQYTSEAFRKELKGKGIIQSLSGTGRCYDNCRMESFFATLKKEKLYRLPTYKMPMAEVKSIIFRYIYGYYNTKRINSFNSGGLPPAIYRKQFELKAKEKLAA